MRAQRDWIHPRSTADIRAATRSPTGLEELGTAAEDLGDIDPLEMFVHVPDDHDVEGADRPAVNHRKDPSSAPPSACSLGGVDRAADTARAVRRPGVYHLAANIVRLVQVSTRARLRQHPEELNVHGEELPANHGELEVQVADLLKGWDRDRGAA
jgi:hypothetical protein